MLDYDYYTTIRDELLDIYIKEGRKGVSDRLDINYNSTGHVLKYLGFYDKDVKDKKWEYFVEEMRKPRHKNPFIPFDKNSAYIFGFIVGDGCLLGNYRKHRTALSNGLDISCNDFDIIHDIALCFGTRGVVGDGYTSKKVYENKNHHTTYSFRTEDYSCIESLIKLGLRERKSYNGCVLNFPKEYYSHFLRGLFDADGYVRIDNKSKNTKVTFELCGHRSYLTQIVNDLDGMFDWKCDFRKETLSFLRVFKQSEVERLYYWMYDDADLMIKRKFMAFYECFEHGRAYEQYREYSTD